jgi:uncharacterized delta-60 repeat protein
MKRQLLLLLFLMPFTVLLVNAQVAGAIDTSFGTNGTIIIQPGNQHDNLQSMAIQPDGKIVFCGMGRTVATTGFNFDVVVGRRNSDGSTDSAFGSNGFVTKDFGIGSDYAYNMALQADGKIVVVGAKSTTLNDVDWIVIRLNSDGSYDTTFSNNGIEELALTSGNDFAYDVAIQPDSKIVIAGTSGIPGFSTTKGTLVRLNANGTLDSTFGTNGVAIIQPALSNYSQTFKSLVLLPSGKIIAGGWSTQSSSDRLYIVGLNSNGSIDSTFGSNGTITYTGVEKVYSLSVANGNLYACGVLTVQGTLTSYSLSGVTNGSFGSSGTARLTLNAIAAFYSMTVQPDGKIVLAGTTGTGAFARDFLTARYLNNGTIDNSFGNNGTVTINASPNFEDLNAIAMQTDGKLLIGGFGSFTNNDMIITRLLNDSAAIITGVTNIGNSKQFWSIYPTPLSGTEFYLLSKINNSAPLSISILNFAGDRVALIENHVITEPNQALKLTLPSTLTSGIYFVQIRNNQYTENKKLILAK